MITASSCPTMPSLGRLFLRSPEKTPPRHTCKRIAVASHRFFTLSKTTTNAAAQVPDDVDGQDEGSSTRSQLDLLEQFASDNITSGYMSDGASSRSMTIREQLSELVGGNGGEFTLPLGKRLSVGMKSLTTSQRRNIKRQAYLNEVSGRNDSLFFAIIATFVILPPVLILAVAILTGYVELFP